MASLSAKQQPCENHAAPSFSNPQLNCKNFPCKICTVVFVNSTFFNAIQPNMQNIKKKGSDLAHLQYELTLMIIIIAIKMYPFSGFIMHFTINLPFVKKKKLFTTNTQLRVESTDYERK